MKSPARYILYTRVSTEGQRDNFSHESQLAALQAHVVKNKGLAVEIIRETKTGELLLGRPGIQRAISLLESDEADVLLCYDMSRYSRNEEHQRQIQRRLSQFGKRLEFATIEFERGSDGELTPESNLMFGVSGSFAAYHKNKIRADCMRGAKQAAEKGNQTRRKPPFGYHIVNNKDVLVGRYKPEQIGQYIIIEKEAKLVRELYERRAAGQSLNQIAHWLADSGVKTKAGAIIRPSAISKILSNTVYKGEAHFGQTRRVVDESRLERGFKREARQVARARNEVIIIPAPAIVDESLWDHVYAMRTTNEGGIKPSAVRYFSRQLEQYPSRYLLSSILRCPRCGSGMSGRSQQRSMLEAAGRTGRPRTGEAAPPSPRVRKRFYVCRRANSGEQGAESCLGRNYRIEEADARMIEFLKQLYSDESALEGFLRGQGEGIARPSTRVTQLREEIAQLETRERGLIEAQLRALGAGADAATYERMLIEASQQRSQAQRELSTLEKASQPKSKRDSATFRRMLEKVHSYLSSELTPGSKALHELHCFLVAQIEYIDFDELDRGAKAIPRYQIGKLKIKAR